MLFIDGAFAMAPNIIWGRSIKVDHLDLLFENWSIVEFGSPSETWNYPH